MLKAEIPTMTPRDLFVSRRGGLLALIGVAYGIHPCPILGPPRRRWLQGWIRLESLKVSAEDKAWAAWVTK